MGWAPVSDLQPGGSGGDSLPWRLASEVGLSPRPVSPGSAPGGAGRAGRMSHGMSTEACGGPGHRKQRRRVVACRTPGPPQKLPLQTGGADAEKPTKPPGEGCRAGAVASAHPGCPSAVSRPREPLSSQSDGFSGFSVVRPPRRASADAAVDSPAWPRRPPQVHSRSAEGPRQWRCAPWTSRTSRGPQPEPAGAGARARHYCRLGGLVTLDPGRA